MTEKEWIDGLRWLPDEKILDLHFELQEKIKKHYKLRDKGNNLAKAIQFCEQQIALAPLAMKAMRDKFSVGNDFYAPSHHGYKQYAVILKKNKELDKLSEITAKMEKGGWRLK